MSGNLKQAAMASVCSRVDKQKAMSFGISEAIIEQVVLLLLGKLIKCFGQSPTERTRRRVEKKTNTPKKRARFVEKTEDAIQHYHQNEYDSPLPDEVAEDMANAFIDECLACDEEHVEAVCSVVSDQEFGS